MWCATMRSGGSGVCLIDGCVVVIGTWWYLMMSDGDEERRSTLDRFERRYLYVFPFRFLRPWSIVSFRFRLDITRSIWDASRRAPSAACSQSARCECEFTPANDSICGGRWLELWQIRRGHSRRVVGCIGENRANHLCWCVKQPEQSTAQRAKATTKAQILTHRPFEHLSRC